MAVRQRPAGPGADAEEQRFRFNGGPAWLSSRSVVALWTHVERYGWFVLLGAVLLAWAWPRLLHLLRRAVQRTPGTPGEGARKSAAETEHDKRLETQRRARVEALQRQLAEDGAHWREHQQTLEQEKQQQRLHELDAKERRLGMRPRGKAHFAIRGTAQGDESDLYT